jgi:hypothetical protein
MGRQELVPTSIGAKVTRRQHAADADAARSSGHRAIAQATAVASAIHA